MTIPEAVSLILTAGSMAHGGEIFVLDMGKPVKILTLAENLIKVYGKKPYEDVEIIFTGLRPGEKLYEELLETQKAAQDRVEIITDKMAKAQNISEAMKAQDQMAWVGAMNMIRLQAEEIVLQELIYS